jgi:diaminopimelate epimerase
MEFFKYQSLGNDFILFDALKKDSTPLTFKSADVQRICHRHFGIGADGILTIHRPQADSYVYCEIFNNDGSKAELCINGIRCIAHYLVTNHSFEDHFTLKMDKRLIQCQIQKSAPDKVQIILDTGSAESYQVKTISLSHQRPITGDYVRFSNPHFIVFSDIHDMDLKKEAARISTHSDFKDQTNVSYITQKSSKGREYDISFYERGVGPTLSCGSGASAAMWALYQRQKIKRLEKIQLHTQGGLLQCYIDAHDHIIQEASAQLVFKGQLTHFN